MTILGNFRRRKDRERIMKTRSPLAKSKPKYNRSRQQLAPILSPIERHLAQTQGPIVPLEVTTETMNLMKVEVQDLDVSKRPVSVAAMTNALAGSRRVISRHGNKGNMNTLARVTRKLQNLAFRRTRTEDESLQRRYAIINAFDRLGKLPESIIKMVSNWGDAKAALSVVILFPEEGSVEDEKAEGTTSSDNDIANEFAKKLDDCFRQEETEDLVSLKAKWKQVAAFPTPSKLGETDENVQAHKTALEEADRMFTLRLHSKQEEFEELVRSKAAKEVEMRRQAAEARKKASQLMRPMSAEEQARVRDAMFGIGPGEEQLARSGSDYVQRSSMQTLRPGQWLNDEIIHYFLLMLAKRDEEICEKDPNRNHCHFFKSFFITKLLNEGHSTKHGQYEYKNVKRWSKKVLGKDLFSLNKIFFPINANQSHWLCACAFMSEKRIEVFDSLGGSGEIYLQAIFEYLQDDHKDKKGSPMPDVDEWELEVCRDSTPFQRNGYDCGVFTCMFIDFLSKDTPLLFSQKHITQCRQRIALSILNGKAIL